MALFNAFHFFNFYDNNHKNRPNSTTICSPLSRAARPPDKILVLNRYIQRQQNPIQVHSIVQAISVFRQRAKKSNPVQFASWITILPPQSMCKSLLYKFFVSLVYALYFLMQLCDKTSELLA